MPDRPKTSVDDDVTRLLTAAAHASRDVASGDLFYRQLALHLAKEATSDFQRLRARGATDGARVVADFVAHEEQAGRIGRHEITVSGEGLDVQADVHQCPYQASCRGNLALLGEVPQCIRAITLIQAISAKVPDRPPMTYDLTPGLVDGKTVTCAIRLRPAGIPARPR